MAVHCLQHHDVSAEQCGLSDGLLHYVRKDGVGVAMTLDAGQRPALPGGITVYPRIATTQQSSPLLVSARSEATWQSMGYSTVVCLQNSAA